MADLDTENKRRSAINIPVLTLPPIADGVIGTQDRPQAGYQYCGIIYGAPVAPLPWLDAVIEGIDVMTGKIVYIVGKIKH